MRADPTDAASVSIHLIGPLRLARAGRPVAVPTGLQRRLLERLLVSLNEVVPADALVEATWGAATPARPHEALQVAVSRLRRTLDGIAGVGIDRRGSGYVLQADTAAVDVLAAIEARRRGTDAAVGDEPFFADFVDEPWVHAARDRLDDRLRSRVGARAVERSVARPRPAPRPGDVARPALVRRVLDAPGGSTVAIVAPAGAGKSTLLAQVAETLPGLAWLGLDPRHDDSQRFRDLLIEVLSTPEVGVRVGERLASVELASPLFLEVLADELADSHAEVTIVVDDAHLLTDRLVGSFLRGLARRLPRTARLVLAGRRLPGIGPAHLRLHGRLVEIGPDELRLGPDEISAVLAAEGLTPDDESVQQLAASTDGWAAAVVLQAMAATPGQRDLSRLRGTEVAVDFVREEVLAEMGVELRRYLCALALVGRFDAAIAGAVWPEADPTWLMHEVETRNLLVKRGVDGQLWFHDLLQAALEREAPAVLGAEVVGVHRRAASALLRTGDIEGAVDHLAALDDTDAMWTALASGSIPGDPTSWASGLFLVEALQAGRMGMLVPWFSKMLRKPPDDPRFGVAGAVVFMGVGDIVSARRAVDLVDRPGPDGSPPPMPLLGGAIAGVLLGEGRIPEARARIEACLDLMDEQGWGGTPAHLVARRLRAEILAHLGDLDGAIAGATAAFEDATALGHHALARNLAATVSFAHVRKGDNRTAQRWLDRAYAARAGVIDTSTVESGATAGSAPNLQVEWAVASIREVAARATLLERAGDPGGARSVLRGHLAAVRMPASYTFTELFALLALVEAEMGLEGDARENLATARRLAGPEAGPNALRAIADADLALRGEAASIDRGVGALDLSEREQTVLRMLHGTLTLREIARELYVSVNTVKTHTQSVYRKLGVSSRAEAVRLTRASR